MITKIDNEVLRRRVVHGWVFRDYDRDTVEQIKRYLLSGERKDLPEEYHGVFDVVVLQKAPKVYPVKK